MPVHIETLTNEQADAVRSALNGRNVFLTGNAGSGKSYTLSCLIAELRKKMGRLFL